MSLSVSNVLFSEDEHHAVLPGNSFAHCCRTRVSKKHCAVPLPLGLQGKSLMLELAYGNRRNVRDVSSRDRVGWLWTTTQATVAM